MRREFINNTTMTLNIRRRKRLPITATVFQRGQVLLNMKTGKGFSVLKKIMTLAIDTLDHIFCVIQEENSGVPREGGKKVGEEGKSYQQSIAVWPKVKVNFP